MGDASWSKKNQLTNNVFTASHKFLFLDANKTDGSFKILGDPNFQVGWGSTEISGTGGTFTSGVVLEVPITSQTVNKIALVGNDKLGQWPTKYDISLYKGSTSVKTITGVTQNSLQKLIEVSPGVVADKIRYTFFSNNVAGTSVKVIQAAPDYRREVTDTNLLTLAEGMVALVASSSTDVNTFSLADTENIKIATSITNINDLSFSELTAMIAKFSATDQVNLTFTDTDNISPKISGTDSMSTSLTETDALATTTSITNVTDISFAENLGGTTTFAGNESTTMVFDDRDNISPKIVNADDISVNIIEADLISNNMIPTDAIAILMDESLTVSTTTAEVNNNDVSFVDSDTIRNAPTPVDTISASLTEKTELESVISDAFWSRPDQLLDSVFEATHKYLFLDYNQVDGTYKILGDPNFQVGWGSIDISGPGGVFNNKVRLEIPIEVQTVNKIVVIGNDKLQQWPTKYDIELFKDGIKVKTISNIQQNTLEKIVEVTPIVEADTVRYTFYSNNREGTCLKVIQAAPDYRKTDTDTGLLTLAEQDVFLVASTAADIMSFSLAEAVSVSTSIDIININDLSFEELTTWMAHFSDSSSTDISISDIDNISPKLSATDTFNVHLGEVDTERVTTTATEDIRLSFTETDAIKNRIKEADSLDLESNSEEYFIMPKIDDINLEIKDRNNMESIHTVLKAPVRTVHCRVRIKYTLDDIGAEAVVTSSVNHVYNSNLKNLINGYREANHKYAYANESNVDADPAEQYHPLGDNSPDNPVGFYGVSNSLGILPSPLVITVSNLSTNVYNLMLVGDIWLNNYPVDFTVQVYQGTREVFTQKITNNQEVEWVHSVMLTNVTKLVYTITKISRPGMTPKLQEVFGAVVDEYLADEIVNVKILEEALPATNQVALGAISANQLDLTLLNKDRQFSANNASSHLRGLLKANREIRVWFGAIINEKLDWYQMGIYYSGPWKTSYSNVSASALATDRLSLLTQTTHTLETKVNISVFQLFYDILVEAGVTPGEFVISEEFRSVIIPYAAIPIGSHIDALSYVAKANMCFIYCDRVGRIIVDRRKEVYPPQVTYERGDIYDYGTVLDERVVVNDATTVYTPYQLGSQEEILNDPTIYTIEPGETRELFIPSVQNELLAPGWVYAYNKPSQDCRVDSAIATSWGLYIRVTNIKSKGQGEVTIGMFTGTGIKLSTSDSVSTKVQLENKQSISEVGRHAWEYTHELIQSYSQADRLSRDILDYHSDVRPFMELDCRGDFAIDLGHDVIAQAYNDFNTMVSYKQIRALHEWDGAYRATVTLEYEGE